MVNTIISYVTLSVVTFLTVYFMFLTCVNLVCWTYHEKKINWWGELKIKEQKNDKGRHSWIGYCQRVGRNGTVVTF